VVDVITDAAPTGPYFMDLDVPAGKIYWGDFGGGSIFRANLDGSGRQTLLTGNNMTRGVRLDSRERMLYWINRDDKKVHRCPLFAFDGGTISITHPAVQTLYTNLDTPHGLALDIPARKIYWADTGTNPGLGLGGQSICRGDFDGSTPLEVLATGTEPWDVDLDLRCTNYVEWTQRCFRRDAPPEQIDPMADPDGDAIPNAAEYAFDLSPMHADLQGLPKGFIQAEPVSGTIFHFISYRRRATASDLSYAVHVATNVTGWVIVTPYALTEQVDVTPLGEGMEFVTERTSYSLSGKPNHFMRVQITHSP
jgi:hypothetical protein